MLSEFHFDPLEATAAQRCKSAVFLGTFLSQDTKKYLASACVASGEMVLKLNSEHKKQIFSRRSRAKKPPLTLSKTSKENKDNGTFAGRNLNATTNKPHRS